MHQLQPPLNTPLQFGCGSRRVLLLFAGEKGGEEDALIGNIATMEELEAAIQTSGTTKPLVLRFHASWCSACKRFAPTWQQTVNAYEEYFDFVDVDVTGKRDIIVAMGLTVLPHSHFYVGGSKVEDFGVSIKKLNGLLERLDKYKKMR
ncbi:hypothetical protein NSK_006336 [Nannochloropsis salina CCMP1776]|uniref:Thioredoxin domain-containing protein n=1 Tax=Nannochloropsis salina CCMP1776 TaxID=1027361 RepID=A0A4D9CXR9_9STRA|nr:hypothetical protein NSK_006336 [Nannochloropsis salina CCMP1776]|eukprot:TFJ82363.1 hypothetical protein NSK_006336 [Nannochloropsis salina CCMP1776]